MFNLKSEMTQIDELTLRKIINPNYFNVEGIIGYVNDNEIITFDVFVNFLTEKGKQNINFSYLNEFKPINKAGFIRRVPIYFNDVTLKNDGTYGTVTDIFYGYAKYINKKQGVLDEEDDWYGQAIEWYKNIDFEPLYKMLERVYYDFEIPFEKMTGYIMSQCGDTKNFEVFAKWFQYIGLLNTVDESNVFPKNILTALNNELVATQQKPYIYFAEDYRVVTTKKGNKRMILLGEFPFDENGDPILKWIGVWCENIGEIKRRRPTVDLNTVPDFVANQFNSSIEGSIVIELKNDSRVFLANETTVDDDMFDDEKTILWIEEYTGPKCMKFDYSNIISKREQMGISQKDAAEAMDINLRTYQRIEIGDGKPDALNLIKIMNYYGLESYSDFVEKEAIEDPNLEKFLSGKSPSYYIDVISQ